MLNSLNGMTMDFVVPFSEFNAALWKRFKEGKIRNVYPKAKYDHILKKLKTIAEDPPINSPGEYYLLRKFVITKVGDDERLSCKNDVNTSKNDNIRIYDSVDGTSNVKFYIALEEIYKFIDEAHKSTKHGGRDRIVKVLQQQGIMNVARDTVELFLTFCPICRPRQKESTRRLRHINRSTEENQSNNSTNRTDNLEDSVTIEPQNMVIQNIVIKSEKNLDDVLSVEPIPNFKRGHIAILDLTASPDGEFRFILLYLDYQTQFTILRPVKCKCTYEIASHLLDVFTFIGPPQILHSDYDSPFLLTVIHEIKQSWPECVIVFSRDSSNSDLPKQCISDVEKMLRTWMVDNSSHRWSFGLRFVQLRKNTKLTDNNGNSPYERFFGKPPQTLPSYLTSSIQKEEELISLVHKHKSAQTECYEQLQVSLDPKICSLVQNSVPHSDIHSSDDLTDTELVIDTSVIKAEPQSDNEESESIN